MHVLVALVHSCEHVVNAEYQKLVVFIGQECICIAEQAVLHFAELDNMFVGLVECYCRREVLLYAIKHFLACRPVPSSLGGVGRSSGGHLLWPHAGTFCRSTCSVCMLCTALGTRPERTQRVSRVRSAIQQDSGCCHTETWRTCGMCDCVCSLHQILALALKEVCSGNSLLCVKKNKGINGIQRYQVTLCGERWILQQVDTGWRSVEIWHNVRQIAGPCAYFLLWCCAYVSVLVCVILVTVVIATTICA